MSIKSIINRVRYGPDLNLLITGGSQLVNRGELRRGYPRSTVKIFAQGKLILRSKSLVNIGAAIHVGRVNYPGAVVEFGVRSYMNKNGEIRCWNSVIIGDDVAIGPGVLIRDTDGGRNDNPLPVIIGDGVWICERVTILKGTTIGRGSIVGAGAVLAGRKSWPERALIVGNPARVVRLNLPNVLH